jgi:hypothetical protein
MVETAIFSIFHRVRPAEAAPPVIVEPSSATHDPHALHGAETEKPTVLGDAPARIEGDAVGPDAPSARAGELRAGGRRPTRQRRSRETVSTQAVPAALIAAEPAELPPAAASALEAQSEPKSQSLSPEPPLLVIDAPPILAEPARDITAEIAALGSIPEPVEVEPSSPPEPPPAWPGLATMADIPARADLLGLANPTVVTLLVRLAGAQGFRAAPWSGFAYDIAADTRTGLVAGTRILTARGELEVERLLPGDSALALRGPALLPITWIGRSKATEPPIRIAAGALGPNIPRRTLCLAPDHPVFLDPIPVPASSLVNGTTIHAVDIDAAELFHIDVGATEVLFAEGVPLSSSQRMQPTPLS